MLAVLLEQDHRQQAGADPAARDDVEGRRRLGHRPAVPAAELLAHGLPHEPAPRNDIERLGDGLADLRQPAPTAAGAARRRRDDDPLARQMLGQWPAGRLLADMASHRRSRIASAPTSAAASSSAALSSSSASCSSSWSSSRCGPLAASDRTLRAGPWRAGASVARSQASQPRPALRPDGRLALGQDHRMRRGKIGGQGRWLVVHAACKNIRLIVEMRSILSLS